MDTTGASPLAAAVHYGHVEITELLLSKGADVSFAEKSFGATPLLFLASQNGHLATAEFLLSKGADVNRGRADGTTPLRIAAQQGHLAIAEVLLSKGR